MTAHGLASHNERAGGALKKGARILVFGESGQLSSALGRVTLPSGWRIECVGRQQADVTDIQQVSDAALRIAPDIMINTAAFTDVDGAESDRDQAYRVNREGAANVARAAASQGVPIIHISTDFVFSGTHDIPYIEDDIVGPISVYGISKEAGECAVRAITGAHAIVRTSWLYSAGAGNFVTSILDYMQQAKSLPVVSDQIGTPTYADDLAQALITMSAQLLVPQKNHYGTFHAAGRGSVSRYDFAREIQAAMTQKQGGDWPGAKCKITRTSTASRKSPAARPAFSALNCNKLKACYGIEFDNWQDSLKRCIALV